MISNLIETGIIRDVSGDGSRFECKCGSVINRASVRSHIRTQKHLAVDEKKEECDICVSQMSGFYSCEQCCKRHCNECHSKIYRCPYCRHPWKEAPREEENGLRTITLRDFLYHFIIAVDGTVRPIIIIE